MESIAKLKSGIIRCVLTLYVLSLLLCCSTVQGCGDFTNPCIMPPGSIFNDGCFNFSVFKNNNSFYNNQSFLPPYLQTYRNSLTISWHATQSQTTFFQFSNFLSGVVGGERLVTGAIFYWQMYRMLSELKSLWFEMTGYKSTTMYPDQTTRNKIFHDLLGEAIFESLSVTNDTRMMRQERIIEYLNRITAYLLSDNVDINITSEDGYSRVAFTSLFTFLDPVSMDLKSVQLPESVNKDIIKSFDFQQITTATIWNKVMEIHEGLRTETYTVLKDDKYQNEFIDKYSVCPSEILLESNVDLPNLNGVHRSLEEIAKYWYFTTTTEASLTMPNHQFTYPSDVNETKVVSTQSTRYMSPTGRNPDTPGTSQSACKIQFCSILPLTHFIDVVTLEIHISAESILQVVGADLYTLPAVIVGVFEEGVEKVKQHMIEQNVTTEKLLTNITQSPIGLSLLRQVEFHLGYFQYLLKLNKCIDTITNTSESANTYSDDILSFYKEWSFASLLVAFTYKTNHSDILNQHLNLLTAYYFGYDLSRVYDVSAFHALKPHEQISILNPLQWTGQLPKEFLPYVNVSILDAFDIEIPIQFDESGSLSPGGFYETFCEELQSSLSTVCKLNIYNFFESYLTTYLNRIKTVLQEVANYWAVTYYFESPDSDPSCGTSFTNIYTTISDDNYLKMTKGFRNTKATDDPGVTSEGNPWTSYGAPSVQSATTGQASSTFQSSSATTSRSTPVVSTTVSPPRTIRTSTIQPSTMAPSSSLGMSSENINKGTLTDGTESTSASVYDEPFTTEFYDSASTMSTESSSAFTEEKTTLNLESLSTTGSASTMSTESSSAFTEEKTTRKSTTDSVSTMSTESSSAFTEEKTTIKLESLSTTDETRSESMVEETGTFSVDNIVYPEYFMLSTDGGDVFEVTLSSIDSIFDGLSPSDVTFEVIGDVESFRSLAQYDMVAKDPILSNMLKIQVTSDMSASWTFKVSINGKPVVNSEATDPAEINVVIKHPAPSVIRSRFTDTGNAIEVMFNVPVTTASNNQQVCSRIFANVDKLGDGASCSFTTPKTLQVVIGTGTNVIEPGDQLMFNQNSIKPAKQSNFLYLNSDEPSAVEAPNNPPDVNFVVSGPTTINNCGSYQLKAEQISGHGGRKLTYDWQLEPTVVVQDSSSFSPIRLQDAEDILPIDATTLTPGTGYTLIVTLTNFLNTAKTRTHTVTVVNDVKPVLLIKPTNVIASRVKTSTRVQLEADVTYSFGEDCTIEASNILYEWTTDMASLSLVATNMRVLVISPNTLPVRESIEFTATVTSTIAGEAITVSELITLTTVATPLVAEIGGASRITLGPSDTIILDGSNSFDPDAKANTALSFEWTCLVMSTNASCNNNLGQTRTSKRFTAQADDFTPGEFTIRLTVSSDTRTAMASMVLIVENEAVPNVQLKTRSGKKKFRDNEDIYFQASISFTSEVNVTWQELNDRLDSSMWKIGHVKASNTAGHFNTHIIIPKSETDPGTQYSIEVRAVADNGKHGTSTFDFSTFQSISQCQIQVTDYNEMEPMKITATGCVTDPDSEPLTYQPFLGLAIKDGSYKTVVLDGSKGDSEQTVIATPIEYGQNEILVGFKVCDASMTCIDAVTNTPYNSKDVMFTDQERNTFVSEKIQKELDKGNVATAFSNAINMANLEKKFLTTQRRRKRDAFADFDIYIEGGVDSILLVVDDDSFFQNIEPDVQTRFDEVGRYQTDVLVSIIESGPVDNSEGDMLLDLSSQMVQQSFAEEEIDTLLDAFDTIITKAESEGHQQSIGTVERAMTTLATSEKKVNSGTDQQKMIDQRQKISELRKSALKQVGKDLAIGSHMTLDVSGAKMAVFCFLPSTEEDAWDVEDTFPVKLRPGGALSDRYNYDWCTQSDIEACTGVKALLIQVQEWDEGIEKCSELTDVTLINPVTDENQDIADLTEPIEVELELNLENGMTCECKFWNEEKSQLESTGVTTELRDGKLICKTVHLTSFVGEQVPVSDLDNPTTGVPGTEGAPAGEAKGLQMGAIIGIIIGVVILIILVVVVVAVVIKVNKEKKVGPNGD
ncbi:uncharacterized protein [Apostichopus japonicus]|uniref:uncharacterized protein isoform X4 n=1 Tax=Stichopus japonicus TaxID=307972 RepID=UPI003AB15899